MNDDKFFKKQRYLIFKDNSVKLYKKFFKNL